MLSSPATSTTISAECIIDVDGDLEDFSYELTQEVFDSLCEPIFEPIISLIKKVLTLAKLTKNEINAVVLVGGTTRIPKVTEILSNFFGENKINRTQNPDQVVAEGAGILAGIKSGVGGLGIDFTF